MVIGIDPGYKGGIAFIDGENIKLASVIPTNKSGDVDFNGLLTLMAKIKGKDVILLEDVHSVFGASAKSNFQFGRICGILRTFAEFTGAELIMTAPKEWQKKVWRECDIVLKGKKRDTKATSRKCAERLFPDFDFRSSPKAKIPHDGIIDAILIASSYDRS